MLGVVLEVSPAEEQNAATSRNNSDADGKTAAEAISSGRKLPTA
jgi:hypothetical protein